MNYLLRHEQRERIVALRPELCEATWSALHRKDPTFPLPPPGECFGARLMVALDEHPVDHLGLLMPLCAESGTRVVQAIEALLGHPITRPRPRASGGHRSPSTGSRTGVRAAPRAVADTRRVLTVVANPKKPGSASHERFQCWTVGDTVQECVARGLRRDDVNYDLDRGFVTVGDPE